MNCADYHLVLSMPKVWKYEENDSECIIHELRHIAKSPAAPDNCKILFCRVSGKCDTGME